MHANPESILEFWFGSVAHDPVEARARGAFWFGAAPETDRAIETRFADVIEAAGRGEFEAWLEDARSALALVIVLDQFPLNVWRGTAKPYSYEAQALHAVNGDYLSQLTPVEGAFLILPYQHSESITCQRKSVRLATELAYAAEPHWRSLMEYYLDFAEQHLAIIERFGRFPHRNRVLGRAPTTAEEEYLAAGGATYGQN